MNDLHLFSMISTGVAGLVIALGTMLPAIAMGRAIASALEALARQPEAAGRIQTAALILAAFIEGAALFGIVIAFQIQGKF